MAYATFPEDANLWQIHIWTGSADGSAPSLLFESAAPPLETGGSPVWSPDGTQVAFESTTTDGMEVWLVTNADGTGEVREIDELRYLSWRGGWYFCNGATGSGAPESLRAIEARLRAQRAHHPATWPRFLSSLT